MEETQDTLSLHCSRAPAQNLTQDGNGTCLKGREKRSWAHSWPHRRLIGLRHLLHPPPLLHRAGPGRGRAGEGGRSKPILISPIMSAGLRLEKASGTLNKKNVANAIIEGGSRRAGIASL